jgi:hypothetical protein
VKASIAFATAIAAVVGLVSTVASGVPDASRTLDAERNRFSTSTANERAQAFGARIPTPMEVFDFYRRQLKADDRFYVQVTNEGFGNADKATVVRSVARLYLAPAIEVARPEDATVVLSYDADPGLLPLRYSEQTRAGLQLFFVSRVA